MSSDIAIRVKNLSKCYQIYERPVDRLRQLFLPKIQSFLGQKPRQYYREFWALRDVSFEIRRGETVGIIGRNGSGKSTLLQMICGTLSQSSGSIHANGRVAALLELGSGFNPEFTGRENVYMNAALLGMGEEEVSEKFDSIANFAEIGEFMERPIKTYSSGMIVRLAFSVAINVDPDILVVDEALSVGDELFQRKCFARIDEIRSAGATVLFVSHSGAQIIELCNWGVLLDAGEVLRVGAPKDVVSSYHKILYAPPDKRAGLKDRLRREGGMGINSVDAHDHPVATIDWPAETFDVNLRPSSAFDYESHGPRISDPVLLTEDGRSANGLVRGRRYRYKYRVDFEASATSVRFGMSIKTTTGYTLAGALSAASVGDALPAVASGEAFDVEFSFVCHLNPGVYFMNAGVFGVVNEGEIVLHRRVDVVAFRVLPVNPIFDTEAVSLEFIPTITNA